MLHIVHIVVLCGVIVLGCGGEEKPEPLELVIQLQDLEY
jgi:hypothetical protein